ncbi:CDP-glycerol glycerophosphotransferase family protein [Virgibacillus oceani]|uniref:CDP-glycerol glycerophosphotransferase family protein n=1 Tax=Virgibacillus oceani TaxID=1479511 RepID=UPI00166515E3|nr:CDP-glycerol glycerophosphotransferase family protein [Virgibacillus oceani]
MARDFAITVYLYVFQLLFNFFKLFPQKKKTVFVASFGDNILFTLNELEKQMDEPVVILKTSSCRVNFNVLDNRTNLNFEPVNLLQWIQSIYHLATCDKLFVDNYFGFLASTNFKPNVQCIQLWHAAGAIKQFGLKDKSITTRSKNAYKRFNKVYGRFTHVTVGSEKMAAIFRQSFGISNDVIVRSGIPRSDFFFNNQKKRMIEQSLQSVYPAIKRKKVILYAPTYRDDELNKTDIVLEIQKLNEAFIDEYILFLRLHPAIKNDFSNNYNDFVYDVSNYTDINHLLVVTDILITDYSSIPFEFSLLERPMIFFAYDLEKYGETRGFWEDYETLVPGPVVRNTNDLIHAIQENKFDLQRVKDFASQWNQYSRGSSSKALINTLYTEEEQYRAVDQN